MPAFRYEAVDGTGRARRGLLEAASARAVRDVLRGDGLFPTAVEPARLSAVEVKPPSKRSHRPPEPISRRQARIRSKSGT